MYPIRYTALLFIRKLMMSLCHIWFGVLRSKNRGFAGFFFGFFLADLPIMSASLRLRCTVLGAALIQNIRRSISLIRRGP